MASSNIVGVTIERYTKSITAGGSSKTLTVADNNNQVIQLDTAAGTTITLPAATGSGASFLFYVSVLATSNSHKIQVANSSDTMVGLIACLDSDLATVNNFAFKAVAGSSDTITLDRTNTGSVILGEWVECIDVATNIWLVRGQLSGAAPATPFSAAV